MNCSCCTCRECELCFPLDGVDFVCAGGSRPGEEEELYYKKYGDTIKRQELDKYHSCMGFHQGLAYYLKKYGSVDKN